MGGRSSSSSSSSVKKTTKNFDNRLVVEKSGIGVSGAQGAVNIRSVDAEVLGLTLDFARDAGHEAVKAMTKTTDESLSILREAKEDNAKEISETLIKSLLIGGLGLAVVLGFRK